MAQFTQEQSQAMYDLLKNIELNAPTGSEPPKDQWQWVMWVAGNKARDLLARIDKSSKYEVRGTVGWYTVWNTVDDIGVLIGTTLFYETHLTAQLAANRLNELEGKQS